MGRLVVRRQACILLAIIACTAVPGCDLQKPNRVPVSATAFLDARKQFDAGENQKALETVSASLDQEPSSWGYFLRAQIYLKLGDEAKAVADCEAGLQIAPGDPKLTWLKGELAKPAPARFQGQFKNPPSEGR